MIRGGKVADEMGGSRNLCHCRASCIVILPNNIFGVAHTNGIPVWASITSSHLPYKTIAQSPTLHTDPNDWYTDEVEECRLGVMRDVFFEAASTLTVALGNMPPHQSVFQL